MSSSKHINQVSKFLSFILRHKPDSIDLDLDVNGWANIDELITKANGSAEPYKLDLALIEKVVGTSDKKRFIISKDGEKIRANQGHSVNVDLQLRPAKPPEFLYHGTATRFLNTILQEGLKPLGRQHVHLSVDIETATTVGQRYGKAVILRIEALNMHEEGFLFYLSRNGVWLTDSVPKSYIFTYI